MTPVVTPSHAVAPELLPSPTEPTGKVRYQTVPLPTFRVRLPAPAPPELRVTARLAHEEGGVWASVPELDLAAEGEGLDDALVSLIGTMREWLTYLREEAPPLTPGLESQRRYVRLLDAPEFSWFRRIELD